MIGAGKHHMAITKIPQCYLHTCRIAMASGHASITSERKDDSLARE